MAKESIRRQCVKELSVCSHHVLYRNVDCNVPMVPKVTVLTVLHGYSLNLLKPKSQFFS